MADERVCRGCGAALQTTDEAKPGFVPASAMEKENILCRRCFRIRHYGEFMPVAVTEADYQAQVARIFDQPGLVLYVIDVFDLAGSLVPNLARFVLSSDVVVVVNKVDLLPEGVSYEGLGDWIRSRVEKTRVPVDDVLFVSAARGHGMDELLQLVFDRVDSPVYVVGMANTGKSTLLNGIAARADRTLAEPYTVSRQPGTTLALSELILDGPRGPVHVFDTPGLMYEARVVEKLCSDCLTTVIPRNRLRPKVYQLNPEQTLFLAGIARLDFVRGDRQPVVLYVSNELPIHRTKLSRADDIWERHRDDLLQVPCEKCRPTFERWRQYRLKRLRRDEKAAPGSIAVSGRGSDIVIPGLGWITLSGAAFEGVLSIPDWLHAVARPRLIGDISRRVGQGGDVL
ncbi:ribosome biogenesis GTPase YqeH [Alicyclobacillus acidiphilus]|uniref:ribosome biogenesis GTPase YqeH n=1 Tax=Alicyclobacillus acidiphilus TaxID=182455 RepID=UPI0008347A1F|nr:ribosome biogenesis GTPase YqeH [Alicyclobacillus acidiphilus]